VIFEISHYSNYQFDSPVFLEPQTLRFKPKTNHLQKLVSFDLDIQPQPVNLSEQIDLEGTQSHFCWFEGLHSQLIVSSHCKMEVPHFNPYDFVVYPDEFTQLGFKYPENIYSIISPNLEPISSTPQLKLFTQEIIQSSSGQTIKFVSELVQRIYQLFKKTRRHSGKPHPPEQTIKEKKGSCRDLTVLAMAICRNVGIASRFVSGYLYVPSARGHELHAWFEVYIPGGGWKGFDSMIGLAVQNNHIAVVTTANPDHSVPITGSIRGSAKSKLTTKVQVKKLRR